MTERITLMEVLSFGSALETMFLEH